MNITVLSVVGARPQFIKLAPLCRAISSDAPDLRHTIVHTGQHYDYGMSAVFFEELCIPEPDYNLSIGSGSHAVQTANMLTALETVFLNEGPDCILVYGDTNSTLAATLAASKLGLRLAHIEAGLRSFDRTMPEEINRIVADHCSDILYVPTEDAIANLEKENLGNRAVLVGDVMYDAVTQNLKLAGSKSNVLARVAVQDREYAVITIHRPANTTSASLAALVEVFGILADQDIILVWPMHPRTKRVFDEGGLVAPRNVRVVEPVTYLEMLYLISNAKVVLTDSGGLQKEAAFVGTPCITIRDETEWTETVAMGANTVCGSDLDRIIPAFRAAIAKSGIEWHDQLTKHYGNGDAANRIVSHLQKYIEGNIG